MIANHYVCLACGWQEMATHVEHCAMCSADEMVECRIECPICLLVSHNSNDVRNRYCGHCHRFHEDMRSEEHTTRIPIGFPR